MWGRALWSKLEWSRALWSKLEWSRALWGKSEWLWGKPEWSRALWSKPEWCRALWSKPEWSTDALARNRALPMSLSVSRVSPQVWGHTLCRLTGPRVISNVLEASGSQPTPSSGSGTVLLASLPTTREASIDTTMWGSHLWSGSPQ